MILSDYPFMITIVTRIGIMLIASLFFGIQRQFSNKPIGFGTFIFVSVGSTALSLTAILLAPESPLHLISSIVTGIGFLGAGALIKTSDKIFGFTSAASIWLFAIIGLNVGLGYYILAATLYAIVWIIIVIDIILERKALGLYKKKLTLKLRVPHSKDYIKKLIGAKRYKTLSISFDKNIDEYTYTIIIENKKNDLDQLPLLFHKDEDVLYFELS